MIKRWEDRDKEEGNSDAQNTVINEEDLLELLSDFYNLCKELQSQYLPRLTPYLHTAVYHLPVLLKNHGNINLFNLQGK